MYPNHKPIKLMPCAVIGAGAGAELFIVEGDSAAGAVGAVRNAHDQAVLPMQGKPLNAWKAGTARVAANALYAMLATALRTPLADARAGGGSAGLMLHDPDSLPYERILLLFDADADGIHCGALMLMFFYRWMRPLLESGRVCLVRPPMFELRWFEQGAPCATPLQAYNEAHQRALCAELAVRGAVDVRAYRYRGLANVDPVVLAATCVARGSRRAVTVGAADARQAIEVFGAAVPGSVA